VARLDQVVDLVALFFVCVSAQTSGDEVIFTPGIRIGVMRFGGGELGEGICRLQNFAKSSLYGRGFLVNPYLQIEFYQKLAPLTGALSSRRMTGVLPDLILHQIKRLNSWGLGSWFVSMYCL